MKPCLDYDDNDEDDENGLGSLLKPTLDGAAKGLGALADDDDEEGGNQQYDIEKYFSNGDIDRGQSGT